MNRPSLDPTPLYLARWAAWLLLVLILPGCATNPVSGQKDLVLMSEDAEIMLGRDLNRQVLKQQPAYDDPRLQRYIQNVGDAVARHSDRANLVYHFTLLDSPQVNAFALPGGYIYIERGLLAYLNTEAELAAVLGHEIGHVAARHAVRQYTAATLTGLVGAVLAGTTGIQATGDLTRILGTAVIRGYGREHELEADRLGAKYLARTGYDPHAMIRVIRLLKAQEGFEKARAKAEHREAHVYHGLFATHPDNDRRLQAVVAEAARLGRKHWLPDKPSHFLHHLDGLVYGDRAADGIRRGNRFYHQGLDFAIFFPRGWRLENHPDRVVAIAPASDGMISFHMADRNLRMPPRAFLRRRLHLHDLSHGQSIRLHGMPGYTAIAPAKTSFGRRPVRFVIFYRARKVLVFEGVSKDAGDPYRYDEETLATARSFHRLRPEERALAQPMRIRLMYAGPHTRFEDLARHSPLGRFAATRLRLLNALYPDGEPRPGQIIKIVR